MGIERWWYDAPSSVVNEVVRCRQYIFCSIHDAKALGFKQQDYIIKEINLMSRKIKEGKRQDEPVISTPKKSTSSGNSSQPKTRWANADIRTAAHKQAIRELASNGTFILDTVVELIDDGYELHVKRTDAGSTIRAMLFCKDRNSPNATGGLSAEAPDAWLALTALVYKHSTILDGRWFDDDDASEESDLWK